MRTSPSRGLLRRKVADLRRKSATRVVGVALAGAFALTGCTGTPIDNIVEGIVGEGAEQLQGGIDGIVEDVLGGVEITSDGELPAGFPAGQVPLVGTVLGGGSAPSGIGWVVRTELGSAAEFDEARALLEDAGYTASAVNSDADSGFGTFTSADHTVVLIVSSSSAEVTATYVVTPA